MMHPGFMHWWKEAQRHAEAGAGAQVGCRPGGHHGVRAERMREAAFAAADDGGGGFGVRRPLRFMAHKLELNEAQTAELAGILDDLKTERAQAAVDDRRAVGTFADALAQGTFDASKAAEGAELRVKSAQRLRDAVVKALARTHALLTDDQRKQLVYLLRSGQLTI